MEKEFVPYDLALELKELGFDETCFGSIDQIGYIHVKGSKSLPRGSMMYNTINCPTFSQAFRWFREEKDLLNHLTTHLNTWGEDGALETSYGYRIMIDKDGWKCDVWEKLSRYETYEEAEFECLVKLIEIVKKQNVK